jgi:RNA polymerase sigma-70 factor (ECF subfamily)
MGHHHAARHTPVHTCGGDTAAATDHLARARGATATGDTGSADLLYRAQRGDRLAFEHLYRRYVCNVERYVIVRMRDWDRDAVPDLVQDTFCIALAELHAADPDVLGWLIGLAAKACTRHEWALRRYLRAALTVGEVAERAATQQPPASGNPAGACGPAPFAHALARLAPRERRAVQLRYLDGLARSMTAQLMGTTAHTVRTLERRALHQLRLSLTAPEPAGAEAPVPPARPAARGARR